jgi:glycosidase
MVPAQPAQPAHKVAPGNATMTDHPIPETTSSRSLGRLAGGMALAAALGAPVLPAEAALPQPDITPVLAADPGSTLPADWRHGPFMEIYVRGYQDSNGDGIGDLRGLISRLDYLTDLGITGLWLMPVTRSQDHDHGYATADYRNIEPDYGTLADFDELLKQAHARGIGVIIDYVINHSAADHALFQQSQDSLKNPFRDWYVWEDKQPTGWNIYGNNPWYESDHGFYFAGFWSEMPDFNLRNPQVLAWHHDNLRFWLNRGVDGFRFDAVGNLVENGPLAWEGQPENHQIMHDVRQLVDSYAQRYMVCEAPGDPLAFAAPNSAGGSFAFNHQNHIVGAALGSPSMVSQVAEYFDKAPAEAMATFVSNHDAFAGARLWDRVRGDLGAYRLAAATYLLQPGTPFIYYGEEIGLASNKSLGGDPKLRTPMSWSADAQTGGFTSAEPFRALAGNVTTHNVAAQQADPASLLSFYKALINLRNSHPSLLKGSYVKPVADGWTMSFQRVQGDEHTVVLFNYKADPVWAGVADLPPGATLQPLWPVAAAAARAPARQSVDRRGRWKLRMQAQSFMVMKVVRRDGR